MSEDRSDTGDDAPRPSHLDGSGKASMVDVGAKAVTQREAVARGRVIMSAETLGLLREQKLEKGDVLGVARIAGIMAAKQTHLLVPLCHQLPLSKVAVRFAWIDEPASLAIEGLARTKAQTGVEMEALTAVQVAALTVYDMLKAVDKQLVISDVHLHRKTGGRSGEITGQHLIPGLDDDPDWL